MTFSSFVVLLTLMTSTGTVYWALRPNAIKCLSQKMNMGSKLRARALPVGARDASRFQVQASQQFSTTQ